MTSHTTTPAERAFRKSLRRLRNKIMATLRWGFAIPRLLRYNPYTGFFGRKLFPYFPFLHPHDKTYYGFAHLAQNEEGLFLDIGANDGVSAMGFRHVNKQYNILSVEPNLLHEPALKNLKKKLKRFDYMLIAAGKENGQMSLHTPLYKGILIHTAATFRADFLEDSMKRQFPEHAKDNVISMQQTVKVVKLDDLNLKPDIIKIDAEGFDYEVLLGLAKTIRNQRPYMLVEYSPDLMNDFERFFKENNYALYIYQTSSDCFLPFDHLRENKSYRHLRVTNIFCIPAEKVNGLPVNSA